MTSSLTNKWGQKELEQHFQHAQAVFGEFFEAIFKIRKMCDTHKKISLPANFQNLACARILRLRHTYVRETRLTPSLMTKKNLWYLFSRFRITRTSDLPKQLKIGNGQKRKATAIAKRL